MVDYATAALAPADKAMLDFAAKLTRAPQAMEVGDVETLRAHGFDDPAISQIVQIAALFNYYNRVADGLGIELEDEWSPDVISPRDHV